MSVFITISRQTSVKTSEKKTFKKTLHLLRNHLNVAKYVKQM